MNPVIELLHHRKSVRAYQSAEVPREVRDEILRAAMRAPTAGNMMLYSILEIDDQALKNKLAETCDNQPFIARAPLVLLFLADYQRWYDYFLVSGVETRCQSRGEKMRRPEEGDLFLACCDALVAAQTAVVAAESLGLGSCYIGDIMENYEVHRDLFGLPQYVFPICLLCFGYPTQAEKDRERTTRFDSKFIVFKNRYRRLTQGDFQEMFFEWHKRFFAGKAEVAGATNTGQLIFDRKFNAGFARELNRSVRAILHAWTQE